MSEKRQNPFTDGIIRRYFGPNDNDQPYTYQGMYPHELFSGWGGLPNFDQDSSLEDVRTQLSDFCNAIDRGLKHFLSKYKLISVDSDDLTQLTQLTQKVYEFAWQYGISPDCLNDSDDLFMFMFLGIIEQRMTLIERTKPNSEDKISGKEFRNAYQRQHHQLLLLCADRNREHGTRSAMVHRWLQKNPSNIDDVMHYANNATVRNSGNMDIYERDNMDKKGPWLPLYNAHILRMFYAASSENNHDNFQSIEIPQSVLGEIEKLFERLITTYGLDRKRVQSLMLHMSPLLEAGFEQAHRVIAYYSNGNIFLSKLQYVTARVANILIHEMVHHATRPGIFRMRSISEHLAATIPDGHIGYDNEVLLFHLLHSTIDDLHSESMQGILECGTLFLQTEKELDWYQYLYTYLCNVAHRYGLSGVSMILGSKPDGYHFNDPEVLRFIGFRTIEVLNRFAQLNNVDTGETYGDLYIVVIDRVIQEYLNKQLSVKMEWNEDDLNALEQLPYETFRIILQTVQAGSVAMKRDLPQTVIENLGKLYDLDLRYRKHFDLSLFRTASIKDDSINTSIYYDQMMWRYGWYCYQDPERLYTDYQAVGEDTQVQHSDVHATSRLGEMLEAYYQMYTHLPNALEDQYQLFMTYLHLVARHNLPYMRENWLPISYLDMTQEQRDQLVIRGDGNDALIGIQLMNKLRHRCNSDIEKLNKNIQLIVQFTQMKAGRHMAITLIAQFECADNSEFNASLPDEPVSYFDFLFTPYIAKEHVIDMLNLFNQYAEYCTKQSVDLLLSSTFKKFISDDERTILTYLKQVLESDSKNTSSPMELIRYHRSEGGQIDIGSLKDIYLYYDRYFRDQVLAEFAEQLNINLFERETIRDDHYHLVPYALAVHLGGVDSQDDDIEGFNHRYFHMREERDDGHFDSITIWTPNFCYSYSLRMKKPESEDNQAQSEHQTKLKRSYLIMLFSYLNALQSVWEKLNEYIHSVDGTPSEFITSLIDGYCYPPFIIDFARKAGIELEDDIEDAIADRWVFPVINMVDQSDIDAVMELIQSVKGDNYGARFKELMAVGSDFEGDE